MSKILIVDDDAMNRRLYQIILEAEGHETHQAEDGKNGIRLAKELLPDLILLDIQMSGMDGIMAYSILQAEPLTKHIPIVALTAYAMEGDKDKLLSIGFKDYIAKPTGKKQFLDIVNKFITHDM
jgi:two-component system cell cycle response regulator DivK